MARPQPEPARSGGGGGKGVDVAGLCCLLATAILSGGLVTGVAHWRWAPLIVDVAGVAAICLLAAVPAALLGVVGALATGRGRRWLGEHIATELARRHHERMVAVWPEQSLTQHLHVSGDPLPPLPLNGGGRRP